MSKVKVKVRVIGWAWLGFSFIEKTKGQLAANMSKKIQIKMIKQMQMARHKLTSYILYVSKNN